MEMEWKNNGKSKVTKKVSKNGNILNTVEKNLSRFKYQAKRTLRVR